MHNRESHKSKNNNNEDVAVCLDSAKVLRVLSSQTTLVSGIAASTLTSFAFNPWDRALYLSVVENRKFLNKQNWTSPWHGASQAVISKAVTGGAYFMAQGKLRSDFDPYLRQTLGWNSPEIYVTNGMIAGAISGVVINPLATIKYHTWGHEDRRFIRSAYHMTCEGGVKPFLRGTHATVLRDVVFGITYECMRHVIPQEECADKFSLKKFAANALAAGVATATSSFFNYPRSIIYGTAPHIKPPSIRKILLDTHVKAKEKNSGVSGYFNHWQPKLRLGWGTGRVAVGIAVSQQIFDCTRKKLNEISEAEIAISKPVKK